MEGNLGPGQGGVTYKSVKECTDHQTIRDPAVGTVNHAHFYATMSFGTCLQASRTKYRIW